jgi:hypothetical protein
MFLHPTRRGACHYQRVGKLPAALVAESLVRLYHGAASVAKHTDLLEIEDVC